MTGATGAAAFPVRSPLVRARPWVSDQTWIAHESHPLFGRMAAWIGSNGVWALGEGGASKVGDLTPAMDLQRIVSDLAGSSVPCVIDPADYQLRSSIDEAMQAAAEPVVEPLEVINSVTGEIAHFNHDVLFAAGSPGGRTQEWSWRIANYEAPHQAPFPALVAIDRKNRPRFVLLGMRLADDLEPTQ